MEILGIISLVAVVVGLLSLVVSAFRAGFLWGLGVVMTAGLILPFYVLKQWKTARDSTLLILGSLVVFAWSAYSEPGWFFGMQDAVKKELARFDRTPVAPLPAAAGSDDAKNAGSATGKPEKDAQLEQAKESLQKALQDKKDKNAPPPEVLEHMKAVKTDEKAAYSVIPVEQAIDHVGKYVRVTEKSGTVHDAILKELRGPVLALEKEFAAGGAAVFEIKVRNIKQFEVLVQSLPAMPGQGSKAGQ